MSQIQTLDYSVPITNAMLWQYDKAQNLFALLEQKEAWFAANYSAFWSDWYNDVFNLKTANEFGLSVWAIILDVPIFADNGASPSSYPAWGFDPYGKNFTHGNFANNGSGLVLPVEERRAVLRLRFHQITTDGTVTSINAALADVFGSGAAYVIDNHDMSIKYHFVTPLSVPLLQTLQMIDVMPRPAGVSATFE